MVKIKEGTFRNDHKTLYRTSLMFGFVQPGGEPSNFFVRLYVYFFNAAQFSFSVLHLFGLLVAMSRPLSIITKIQLFRRLLAGVFLSFRSFAYYFKYSELTEMINDWDNSINKDYCRKERKNLLQSKLIGGNKILRLAFILRLGIAYIYCAALFLKKDMRFSEYAGYPHDKNSPYHFFYVALHFTAYIFLSTISPPVESILFYYQCMAVVQFQVLNKKLKQIFDVLFIEDGQLYMRGLRGGCSKIEINSSQYISAVKYVDGELKMWVDAHQKALKWSEKLKKLVQHELKWKYVYIALHCGSAVIGIGAMVKSGFHDILILLAILMSNVSILLASTRVLDQLAIESANVAQGGMFCPWYCYPAHIQRKFLTIVTASKNNPIRIKVFKILVDNSETFRAVMSVAYQMMTFLLVMTDG